MKYSFRLITLMLAAGVSITAQYKDLILIANPNLARAEISASDLRQIYLGTKTTVLGRDVEPVVAASGRVHEQFVSACLGKTSAGLRNYFRNLVFTGKGSMPRSFGSSAEMVLYVARTPGAVGYVEAGVDLTGVVKLTLR